MKRTDPAVEMPFLEHLEELRWRLVRMIGALFIGVIFGLWAVRYFNLIGLLGRPAGEPLIYTHPADVISTYVTVSVAVGIVVALPIILYQLWGFVAPALKPGEKRVTMWVFAGGTVLFLMGVALAFFFVVPATLEMNKVLAPDARQMLSMGDYFSFLVTLCLTFGAAFELPILIMALSALGLVTPAFLRNYRRHALVLCTVGAAFITPGDIIWSTLALLGPLYLLYELGILLSVIAFRWRERRDNNIGDTSEESATS